MNSEMIDAAFVGTKPMQIRQKDTVSFSKQPQKLKCTTNCAAKQVVSLCSGAVCMYLNKLIYRHLVQNCPLSMQMSLISKKVAFIKTSTNQTGMVKTAGFLFEYLIV